MIRNPHFQRLQNIAYTRLVKKLRGTGWISGGVREPDDVSGEPTGVGSSVSAPSAWVEIAAAAADGTVSTAGLRRLKPVMDIVETVPPGDGIAYAKLIQRLGGDFLSEEKTIRVDRWGDPIRWPGFLLGTPTAFSPTSLRYLATALWLREEGLVERGGTVVEIGVGFGGLAAMNRIVSVAGTVAVDLPQVEGLAARMLGEVGLGGCLLEKKIPEGPFTFVSNYAFTELSARVQDIYFEKWIRHSRHGLIVSNANIFSRSIGGRDDTALLELLESAGFEVTIRKDADFLCRSDHVCDVSVFTW